MFLLRSALLCVALAAPSNQSLPAETGEPSAGDTPALVASETGPQAQVDPAGLQQPSKEHTGFRTLFAALKGDIAHLPSTENLYLAGIGGALALGAHPFDQTVNARFANQYDLASKIFAPAQYYGDTPEQMAFSIGTYALGRLMDKPRMAHLGMDLLRAQAVTEMLVEPLKFATHRARPDDSNNQSFPSGHAAITFAAAAVIERHLGWKRSLAAYAIASYVAAARLHENRHYLSDVIFGAAVGTMAGRTVTVHGREHWALGPTAVPGGVAISATRTGS
jgi:membrane-associated phospholipid phosphatase